MLKKEVIAQKEVAEDEEKQPKEATKQCSKRTRNSTADDEEPKKPARKQRKA